MLSLKRNGAPFLRNGCAVLAEYAVKRDTLSYLMLYKGKLDQIIMCLYVEVICKIQTMYVTNLRSGLEYIVKEQNDLAKDYYKKIAQPVRV